jgi:hypothetical protein
MSNSFHRRDSLKFIMASANDLRPFSAAREGRRSGLGFVFRNKRQNAVAAVLLAYRHGELAEIVFRITEGHQGCGS